MCTIFIMKMKMQRKVLVETLLKSFSALSSPSAVHLKVDDVTLFCWISRRSEDLGVDGGRAQLRDGVTDSDKTCHTLSSLLTKNQTFHRVWRRLQWQMWDRGGQTQRPLWGEMRFSLQSSSRHVASLCIFVFHSVWQVIRVQYGGYKTHLF